jgi:ribosomal protein S18 acetylase RimI-like enzyme
VRDATTVKVRLRQGTDLQACVEALAEVHRKDDYPTRWPSDPVNWLTPPALLAAWVVADSDIIQAHLALVAGVKNDQLSEAARRPANEIATVTRLFVRPAARGNRLGERLLRTAGTYAVDHNLALVLDVVDEGRSAAIRLYERLGWHLVAIRPATWLMPSGDRPQLRIYVHPGPRPTGS